MLTKVQKDKIQEKIDELVNDIYEDINIIDDSEDEDERAEAISFARESADNFKLENMQEIYSVISKKKDFSDISDKMEKEIIKMVDKELKEVYNNIPEE